MSSDEADSMILLYRACYMALETCVRSLHPELSDEEIGDRMGRLVSVKLDDARAGKEPTADIHVGFLKALTADPPVR